MMAAAEYLSRSRLFRRLKNGPHGQLVELDAARLVKDGLARQGTWRSFSLFDDLMSWVAAGCSTLTDLDEGMVERHFQASIRERQSTQPGDRAALKRLLSVLGARRADYAGGAATAPPHDEIFEAFSHYLRKERGLAPQSIVRHLPFIRLFLREVCPAGASDLGRICQEDVNALR